MTENDNDNEFRELKRAVDRLPKSIEPPRDLWPGIEARLRRPSRLWYWIPLAAAAALVFVLVGRDRSPAWDVTRLAGRPLVGTTPLAASGRVREGDWVQTDDSSRALIQVGEIGELRVRPETRIQLVSTSPADHRFALAHGVIDAEVTAMPRLFFVDTPAGTAIDLGCAYTLATDSLGNGQLHVTAGDVEFETGPRSSRVPMGARMQTRGGVGPGIPYAQDAPAPFVRALVSHDFEKGGARSVRTILALARPHDALSLWHLLQRVDAPLRAAVYDRLAALVPPPPGVNRAAALRLEARALEGYWTKIHSIHTRRIRLLGVREIDPSTGTAPRKSSNP